MPLNPEAKLQTEIAAYLRSHLRPPAFFSAIGHGSRGGGEVGFLRGVWAKGMGVKTDIPDLYFRRPWNSTALGGAFWPTFWIELKMPGRPVPTSQLDFHDVLRSWGDIVDVAHSIEETIALLTDWDFDLSDEKLSTEAIRRGFNDAREGPTMWPESADLGRKRKVKG